MNAYRMEVWRKMEEYQSIRMLLFILLFLFALNSVFSCATVVPNFTTSATSICGPGATTISFTNTSTGVDAGASDYEWYLNGVLFDNTTGLGAPINSNISAVGTYTYMLIVTNPAGTCSDTATVVVRIHPVPTAGFSFTPNNACAGTNVAFTNTSTGTTAGTTYLWNFGDGFTSTATNPTHAYTAGGTFNVTLTVTNGPGCTSTFVLPVTALAIPVPSIIGDDGDGNTTNCLLPADPTTSETVTFTNFTTGAVSYVWNFGDGATSTATNPSHTYTSFGTYTVTMTATGANGCTATTTLTVVFEKYVSSSLTLDITEYSGCAPHTLTTLTNLSVNANTYTWNFGDGSPPVTTTSFTPPTHTYTTGGTYTITLTAANSCNSATATISPIIIVAGPNANFNASTTLGCAPQNISFVNTSTGASPANNYQWNMGNGNTYTNVTTPPMQTYTTTGTYTVTLIAGSACGYDTITQTIIIDSIPVADIVSVPIEGCTPLLVATTNNSFGASATYSWVVDGVFTSGAFNLPNQTFTAPPGTTTQTHTIQFTISNHCGTDTDIETIIVHPAVVAQFSVSTDTICEGGSITFTNNSLGDSLTYVWDFGEGTTSTLNGPHTITYNLPGTYNVMLITDGYCGTDTLIQPITVLPYPLADFTPSVAAGCNAPLVVNFTNNSTLGPTYGWTFGTGSAPATSTLFTPPTITYSVNGTSMVVLTVNSLGCISTDTAFITIQPLPVPVFTITPAAGCSPLTVTFNNTSTVTAGDTYAWDFGNGTTSTAQNPGTQTYTTGATTTVYTVQLVITTANGCIDSVDQTVTVNPLPIADFTPLPDTVCATTPVAYLNNSIGASTYSWSFGDGGTTTLMSPSHSYTAQGTYTTQLIAATGFGCTDTITAVIVVDSIPTSLFNFSIECVGDSTTFTDLSTGGITNWLWDFGDGTTSTLQHPSHLYATNGTYLVSLTVTNPAGCTHTSMQMVTVNLVPTAAFTTSTTCLGQVSTFTDNTTGVPTAWIWDFGDGSPTSALQNPTHSYTATGTYTVQLIAFGGTGCADTITGNITVTPIPTADFTFTSVCTNDTTFFNSTSLGTPDTFVWNFGDGSTDATNNPTPFHIYTTSGTYNVTLTAGYAASGCTHSVTYTVDAHPRTIPNFTNNTPCLGASTNFTDLTSNTPILWTWDFGDGSPADLSANPSHSYTAPGFYTVTLITENIFTCVDTFTNTIQVFPLPVADFSFDTVCATFNSTFTDLSTSATSWNWNFGDGSPVDLNASPSHVFPASGTYSVEQIVTNVFGCTDTSTQNVTVNPNPVADFSSTIACHTYPNAFTDLSTGAITWEWDFGDGSAPDLTQHPNHTYPLDGTYNVELVVFNVFGCSDSTTQIATVLLQPQSAFTNTTVCAGQVVSFTDATTGLPTTWNWNYDDGTANDFTPNTTHVFTTGGTYNITLITGNAAGCMDTLISPITVYTVPVPNFTADTVCLFNVTHFTDLSTDGALITDWFWDFGDGNNSLSQHPNYIYATPGTYTVTLTVTNINGCDSSITLPVVVNDIPIAAFMADTACTGSPTNFTDLSTGSPTSWLWNFGDGTTSTVGPTVSHTYPGPGTYVVTLIVGDPASSCSDMTIQIVTVSNTVTASFTGPDTACVREYVTFTDNSTSTGGAITSYYWDLGNGTSSSSVNATTYYDMPGTYTVTHTVAAGGGCSSTFTQDILVLANPTAIFTTSAACEGQSVTFTSTSLAGGSPISTVNWYFGDGTTGSGTPTNHTYASSGTYNVELEITSLAGCFDSLIVPITINPVPNAAFTNNVVCLGDTVSFEDLSTISSGSITNWQWNFGDGTGTSSAQHPMYTYTVQNDTFAVSLVVTSDAGCTDTLVQNVLTLPIVDFNFAPDVVNGCQPLMVNFSDNSTMASGTIVGWVWNFDDGNFSFQPNPTHVYINDGQYYVTLTVTTSHGCTYTDSLLYPITVYPQPVAGFNIDPVITSIFEPDVQFEDLSTDAMYWEYDFGDYNYSNASSPEHHYTAPGTYNVMQIVTNSYGCSDTIVHPLTILEESTFFVPNSFTPNGDGLNELFFPSGSGILDLKFYVFDRWGELIFQTTKLNDGWDGTYKGWSVKSDVYVWKAIVTDLNNDVKEYYGHVTVVR